MVAYLLDTNHLSDAIKPSSRVRGRIEECRRTGVRVGTCIPVLCEIEAGLARSANQATLRRALDRLFAQVRIWPIERSAARLYGEIYVHLRTSGRVLSQVDLMVAALARDLNATVVTSDQDFQAVPGVTLVNWLAGPTSLSM